MIPPKRVQSEDRVLNAVQDGLIEFARGVCGFPAIDGVRKQSIAVATTETQIAHGLQRVPQGWIVTDIIGAATVRRTGWDARYITLRASTACTVDLLIF